MEITSFRNFRQQIKVSLDKVRRSHKPLVVDCGNDGDIVIISKAEYDNMQETFRLFKSATVSSQNINK
ncbi:type II toxin-antitoxin system Phd/YefM family antitoxin [Mucilaginibacter flavus]|uniref:type II toxin-antitoxin system Phd/YefM family antitoxin n=1 Tax=Mucilaginibacter flavus TaxID=931504 RepID=UPI0025B4DC01|nr:type II toxin-antitoxin system Phd/YefM family antitoxin [Mucilaginibacter flavus]